jgi:uncharacterized protein YndB with AHSA1/START domain
MGTTVELTRTVDAPPEAVFRALTDPQELSRWWTTSAESDPRTGGSFSYAFEFEDASRDHTYRGEYDEVRANEVVAYPWEAGVGQTRVACRLRPADGGTELTLVHSGWPDGAEGDEAAGMHRQGWTFFLDNLVSVLERGEDMRAAGPMKQKASAAPRA